METLEEERLALLRTLTSSAIAAAAATPFAGTPQADILPGVRLFYNSIEGSSLLAYTAQGHLPLPASALSPKLWEGTQRLLWDGSYDSVTEIVSAYAGPAAGEHAKLVRLQVKPVFVVAARDFCMLQMRSTLGAGATVASVGVSVEDARVPETDCVRGQVLPGSAWVLTEGTSPSGATYCTLTYTIATDIKGWVPAMMVNAAVGSTLARYFEGLAKASGCKLGMPA